MKGTVPANLWTFGKRMRSWLLVLTLTGLFCAAAALAWWLPERARPEPAVDELARGDSIDERKGAFIQTLLPHIREQNRRIAKQRERIQRLHDRLRKGQPLSRAQRQWLVEVARRYRLPRPEALDAAWTRQLLRRVDVIPADLALAQGAIESAWGRSRFAREGHNYFGQWCFQAGCGLVPKRRSEGASHEVQVFDSPAGSVRIYMRNLNSHPAYARLRRIRAELRRQGRPVTGAALAAGLNKYSALGETYGQRLRSLIEHNELARFRRDWTS